MNKRLLLAGSVRVFTRYKLRSFFMGLGIVIGVAALVVMRSVGSGAERDMLAKIERMFSGSSIIIVNGSGAMHGGRREPGKLTIEDLEAIDDQLEQVVDWDPTLAAGGQEAHYGDRSRSLLIIGHSERAATVWGRGVADGEFLSVVDVRSDARVALIGGVAAEALFGDEDPVGKNIRIGSAPFRVKGVLEPYGVDPHGMNRDDEIHVPITTMMRRVLNRDTIGTVKLLVSSVEEVDDTVDAVAGILQERHGLALDEPDDFSLFTPTQVQKVVREANRVLAVYLPATAGIALLVAGIVIANLMLMGVRERIAEIGLRKAVGATDRQICGQFLLESLAITAIAGALGVGLGVVVLGALSHAMGPTRIAPDAVVLGLAAAVVVGVLAGFLPARRAARQEPVDALR